MSGPFAPLGAEAVVITGILMSLASFASMMTLDRNTATGTTPAVLGRLFAVSCADTETAKRKLLVLRVETLGLTFHLDESQMRAPIQRTST
jgi:hypothetical protein